jgi:hypothetical protein
MKAMLPAFLATVLALVAAPALAKSQTVKIEITGPGLAQPLEITDPAIVERFSIWNGPGTARKVAARDPSAVPQIKTYADWLRGAIAQPDGLQLYTVTFHQESNEQTHEWHRTYVVKYGYDPKTAGGYIYLPGPQDGETYQRNVFSISHGGAGKWFHASQSWEQLVAPLIQQRFAR